MKNTKIMAVLVVLLAAMLFVGAASAGANNGTVFVNQELNLSGINVSSESVTLYKMSGDDR